MANEITQILSRISAGESAAVDELVPLVYLQMRKIAAAASHREPVGGSEPTELVHEAYIRMVGNEKLAWQSRSHFFGACSTVIRRILVDQARSRGAAKRGGDMVKVDLNDQQVVASSAVDWVDLDDALGELEKLAPRQVRLIELRYFGGLSESEAAEVLNVSRRTLSGDWAMAKAWLKTRLS
jgi:RNA polymerase sigma factor (TIGR02999 family)